MRNYFYAGREIWPNRGTNFYRTKNHVKPPETHPSLIVRIKGPRNEQAWGEFVLAYEPFLRRLVERQGVPERHVPDMVQ